MRRRRSAASHDEPVLARRPSGSFPVRAQPAFRRLAARLARSCVSHPRSRSDRLPASGGALGGVVRIASGSMVCLAPCGARLPCSAVHLASAAARLARNVQHRARRWSPVCECSHAATVSGVPATTTCPPRSPPSGPRSTIQSAVFTTSRLCSMTTTVFAVVRAAGGGTRRSCSVSWKCSPVVGSFEDVEGAAGVALGQLAGELHPAAPPRPRGWSRAGRGARRTGPRRPASGACGRPPGPRRRPPRASSTVISSTSWMVRALVPDVEGLAVEPLSRADVAGHVDVGQEVHLHLDHSVAAARLAPPAAHVEAETPGAVAARARLGGRREELADRGEQPRVRGGVGAGGTPDRALVDVHDPIDQLQPFDPDRPAPPRRRRR